jgi:hypothetical protein
MDVVLWVLALVAVASAVAAGRAVRSRVRRAGPLWSGGAWVLTLGVAILGWAACAYVTGSAEVARAVALVADGETRSQIELVGRSELSTRFALTVAASLPALVFGIGFLPSGRRPADAR